MRRDDLRAMSWENQAAMSVGMQQAALNATRPVSDAEALDAIDLPAIEKYLREYHGEMAWLVMEYHAANDPQTMLHIIGRAAALQHWLTDPCPDCLNGVEAIPNGIGDPIATGPCRTCDGRGWVPKGGVGVTDESMDVHPRVTHLLVPLDWVKGVRL